MVTFAASMTTDQLQWLNDPESELQRQPAGTLVVMRSNEVKINLTRLLPFSPGDKTVRFQRLPDFRVMTVSEMHGRKAQFALLS